MLFSKTEQTEHGLIHQNDDDDGGNGSNISASTRENMG
jgi:hypothetical protein